jgi:hypothetical protein
MLPHRLKRSRDDALFDCYLPAHYRRVARQCWSPLDVAVRVARWLDELEIASVVDVGSGVGKFCIATALASHASFVGIEQRGDLVGMARGIALMLGLDGRVRFIEGIFGDVMLPVAGCYYFFNPFGESLFGPEHRLHDEVEVSQARSLRDVRLAEKLLTSLPVGTYVITYNGFGGTLPDEYVLLRSASDLPFPLRLAQKRC